VAQLRTGRRRLTQRQPIGQAVATWHQTGGGRRKRIWPSGLQRPGGPVSEMENENENEVGLG
jgi:hypothetical protein